MKTRSVIVSTKNNPAGHSNNILINRGSRLPLSKQVQLASDALAIGNLLELINDIESKPEMIKEIDIMKVKKGIQYFEKLQKGEDYLNQRKTSLIPRPESADTVGHIRKRTGLQIKEKSEAVLNVLNEFINWPESQSKLDSDKLDSAKHFLRDVHTGIMDHLEASDEIDFEL